MEFINRKEALNATFFQQGFSFLYTPIVLSKDEVISFALENDPLPFHLQEDEAQKSVFKSLVASGSQLFTVFYKRDVIPLIGHSILAGLEINNWKFLQPVYPNQPYVPSLKITYVKKNEEKNHAVIKWLYEFRNKQQVLVQSLEITSLHKI